MHVGREGKGREGGWKGFYVGFEIEGSLFGLNLGCGCCFAAFWGAGSARLVLGGETNSVDLL